MDPFPISPVALILFSLVFTAFTSLLLSLIPVAHLALSVVLYGWSICLTFSRRRRLRVCSPSTCTAISHPCLARSLIYVHPEELNHWYVSQLSAIGKRCGMNYLPISHLSALSLDSTEKDDWVRIVYIT